MFNNYHLWFLIFFNLFLFDISSFLIKWPNRNLFQCKRCEERKIVVSEKGKRVFGKFPIVQPIDLVKNVQLIFAFVSFVVLLDICLPTLQDWCQPLMIMSWNHHQISKKFPHLFPFIKSTLQAKLHLWPINSSYSHCN